MSAIFLGGPWNGLVETNRTPLPPFIELSGEYRYRRIQRRPDLQVYYIPWDVTCWKRSTYIRTSLANLYLTQVEKERLRLSRPHPLAGRQLVEFTLSRIPGDFHPENYCKTLEASATVHNILTNGEPSNGPPQICAIRESFAQFELLARPASGERTLIESAVDNMFLSIMRKLIKDVFLFRDKGVEELKK